MIRAAAVAALWLASAGVAAAGDVSCMWLQLSAVQRDNLQNAYDQAGMRTLANVLSTQETERVALACLPLAAIEEAATATVLGLALGFTGLIIERTSGSYLERMWQLQSGALDVEAMKVVHPGRG